MIEYWPNRRPASPNMQQVKAVLGKFIDANSCELISTYYEPWNWDSSKLDPLDLLSIEKLKKYLCRAPDPSAARRIVAAELKGEAPEMYLYDLDGSGEPKKSNSDEKLTFKTSDCSGSELTIDKSFHGEGIPWRLMDNASSLKLKSSTPR